MSAQSFDALIAERLPALEFARLRLRRRVMFTGLLIAATVLVALPLAFASAISLIQLIGRHISKSVFGVVVGFVAGIGLTAYLAFLLLRKIARRGAGAQDAFAQRWNEQLVLPLMSAACPGVRVALTSPLKHRDFLNSRLFGGSEKDSFDAALCLQGSSHSIAWRGSRVNVSHTMVNRQENRTETVWRLRGWFFQLDWPLPLGGTLRLVDRALHEQNVPGYRKYTSPSDVVRSDSGDAAFDALGLLLLDRDVAAPGLPGEWLSTWLLLRERLGPPVFFGVNEYGAYFAVATGDGELPLDYSWLTRNQEDRLAQDAAFLAELPWALEQLSAALAASQRSVGRA